MTTILCLLCNINYVLLMQTNVTLQYLNPYLNYSVQVTLHTCFVAKLFYILMRLTIREDLSPVLKLVTHGAGCTKQKPNPQKFW